MIMGRALHALVLLGAAMAALGGAACATPLGEDASDGVADQANDALIGGKAASASQFPATVYLKSGCTATKVAPKRLLTAAHCVLDPATVSIRFPKGSKIAVSHQPSKGFADVEVAAVDVN